MNKLSVIRFNDDNHPERIWVNGQFIGTTSNIEYVLSEFLDIINQNHINGREYFTGIDDVEIWVCDDFDDMEEDDVDEIWDFFNQTDNFTEEQINFIHNKDWGNLLRVIE